MLITEKVDMYMTWFWRQKNGWKLWMHEVWGNMCQWSLELHEILRLWLETKLLMIYFIHKARSPRYLFSLGQKNAKLVFDSSVFQFSILVFQFFICKNMYMMCYIFNCWQNISTEKKAMRLKDIYRQSKVILHWQLITNFEHFK